MPTNRLITFCPLLAGSLFAAWPQSLAAQVPPEPDYGCKIRYSYDAAGNRTRREWYCWGNEVGGGGDGRSQQASPESQEGPLAANDLTTIPNPASDRLHVELKLPVEDGLLELTSIEGQVVQFMRMVGTQAEFDVSTLSAGAYFVRLTVGNERLMTTFTVDHP